ncbi:outer membrane lipoprotein carrier protein LolA [Muricauda sp. 40Bstr401]|uniref:Outer membrane lipoprotein carrier protein LolA n=2 Tax=Flagellimonas sediminis TaxID=2696468 RepID=A0A6I5KR93_9FLAO|nr:outer membrane lipoprotein carrier protein LolA [Allomuricauda sediminis]NDV43047.1 outer membrane lipoprotein carrier protein LolA [Allomuricauda sediminis]
MIKKYILFIALATVGLFSYGQDANKAKSLLDDVYNKVKSYDNIYIEFQSSLENTEANIKQETNGNVTLKGEKYVLNYLGAEQLFDGKKVYTIVPENEEVTIEDVNEEEDNVSPSKMLTFYKTGHNYKWDILQNVGGRKIQYVKLTPIDSNSEIKSILLGIDTETKHIYKLIQTGNNGTKTTITVNSFKTNQPLSSTLFTFNEKKYEDKGYYITRN